MPTELPEDKRGSPIPALTLADDGAHSIAFSATSARNVTAFSPETKIVSLYADQPVYLKLGDNTVTATATDHYFPAGIYYDISLKGRTHIAALQVSAGGTLYLSEKD